LGRYWETKGVKSSKCLPAALLAEALLHAGDDDARRLGVHGAHLVAAVVRLGAAQIHAAALHLAPRRRGGGGRAGGHALPLPAARRRRPAPACARRRVLLADHSKVGNDYLTRFADLADIDTFITDDGIDPQARSDIAAAGPRVVAV